VANPLQDARANKPGEQDLKCQPSRAAPTFAPPGPKKSKKAKGGGVCGSFTPRPKKTHGTCLTRGRVPLPHTFATGARWRGEDVGDINDFGPRTGSSAAPTGRSCTSPQTLIMRRLIDTGDDAGRIQTASARRTFRPIKSDTLEGALPCMRMVCIDEGRRRRIEKSLRDAGGRLVASAHGGPPHARNGGARRRFASESKEKKKKPNSSFGRPRIPRRRRVLTNFHLRGVHAVGSRLARSAATNSLNVPNAEATPTATASTVRRCDAHRLIGSRPPTSCRTARE